MLRVGTGAMSLERFAEALHAGDKRAMGAPAAARGLCLIAVNY
jgi:tRNA U38,U39,U40 pseudouridine synthase TruA